MQLRLVLGDELRVSKAGFAGSLKELALTFLWFFKDTTNCKHCLYVSSLILAKPCWIQPVHNTCNFGKYSCYCLPYFNSCLVSSHKYLLLLGEEILHYTVIVKPFISSGDEKPFKVIWLSKSFSCTVVKYY